MSRSPILATAFLAVSFFTSAFGASVNVRDFGATGDGQTKDHPAIQKALDACAASGGGEVHVPAGHYVCGTIELHSHTSLVLETGAVLLGSAEQADYRKLMNGDFFRTGNASQPHNRDQSLIVAHHATDVGISGAGTINARGENFYDFDVVQREYKAAVKPWRPGPTIALFDCTNVTLQGFTVEQNPFFAVNLIGCTSVQISKLRIVNDYRFQNADGIHIACSHRVSISDCDIDTEDDALCFFINREGLTEAPAECREIVVTNCILASSCSGVRIGYSGDGSLGDMTFSNIVIRRALNGIDFLCTAKNTYAGETGSAGPTISHVLFSNIIIQESEFGLTANLAPDARPPGGIDGLVFSQMKVRARRGNYFAGNEYTAIHDLEFRDVDFTITGKLENPATQAPNPLPIWASRTVIPNALLLRYVNTSAFSDCRLHFAGDRTEWPEPLKIEHSTAIDAKCLQQP